MSSGGSLTGTSGAAIGIQEGYGLILKKPALKTNAFATTKKSATVASAFGDDSSSEDEDGAPTNNAFKQGGKSKSGRAGVNYMMMKEAEKNKTNAKHKEKWAKAMKEDATVFQYDEVYDDMAENKSKDSMRRQETKKKDARPQYMEQLYAAAAERKLRDAQREDRQAQKERVIEGDEFEDKEQFVTESYRKKLEERKSLEEEMRKKEEEEARNDVTKKGNLNDFWKNLYHGKNESGGGGVAAEKTESENEAKRLAEEDKSKNGERKRFKHDRVGTSKNNQPVQSKPVVKETTVVDTTKFERKATEDTISDAKARFLARKKAKEGQKRNLPTFDA